MVLHHLVDGQPDLGTVHVERRVYRIHARRGTAVGLLRVRVVRIREYAVLEMIDAERHGLAIRHRAEVCRDLHAVLVRLVDRRAELIAADRRVRLEPRHTLLRPVPHDAPCFFRVRDRVHRHRTVRRSLQIGTGDDDLRTNRLAIRDQRLDVHLLIRIDAARRANGRHAVREEEAWVAHPPDLYPTADPRRVVHVVVQTDEPGNHRVAAEIQHLRAGRNGDAPRLADGADPVTGDEYRLVVPGGRTSAIHEPDVRQRNHWRVDGHEGARGIAQIRPLRGERDRGNEGEARDDSTNAHRRLRVAVASQYVMRDGRASGLRLDASALMPAVSPAPRAPTE